ncbi:uncharacterized protein C2845_PM07G12030 [Panicum miliaceum]|uniref:Uncharacterized protein n=1 Tax=Panicum miliaceum TaxID=4540 RepID=A0A3L6SQ59_PANMI|nr:uncharacterized protein C2845_PM07G12030 [Panicum miliaceum]
MRPARRGGAVGVATARALLLLLFLVLLIGSRCSEAIRALPRSSATGGNARNRSHSHGGRVAVLPLPGTRPVPVLLAPAGSAEEESKRRIPSCPDPLHNR